MVTKEVVEENHKQEKEGSEAQLFARLTESDTIENPIKLPAFDRIEAPQHGRELLGVDSLDQSSWWNPSRRANN